MTLKTPAISIATLFFAFGLFYTTLPVMAFNFFIPYILVAATLTVYGLLNLITGDDDVAPKSLFMAAAVFGFAILYAIISSPSLHSHKCYLLLGEVDTGSSFSGDIPAVDNSQIRYVDEDMALRLAGKKMSNAEYGSRYTVGKPSIQEINGKLWWLAPLEFSSLSKWLTSTSGAPAYIKVSATDPSNIIVVRGQNIRYQDKGGFFGDNIYRHLYFHGFMTRGLTDATLEEDPHGNIKWIVTVYDHTIGLTGAKVTGVAVVDPTSGEIDYVKMSDIPKEYPWVDRVIPERFATTQAEWWGRYAKGWINAVFTGEGVLEPTKHTSLVYNNNRSYWYTGMKLMGKTSSIGNLLIDTRTKKATLYKVSGATEANAKNMAEGMVQEKNYKATWPILYNVGGVETYVMSLKNKEGIVVMFAMVNMSSYNIAVTGNTVDKTYNLYRSKLIKGIGNTGFSDIENLNELTGKITRIGRLGDSMIMLISASPNKPISVDATRFIEALLTKEGDNVSVKVMDSDSSIVDAISFDNLDIGATLGPKEGEVVKKDIGSFIKSVKSREAIKDTP